MMLGLPRLNQISSISAGTVGEGDNKNRFCKCIYDSEGFAFAVIGKALSLEVHVVAGSGTGEWAVGVHAMGNASFSLFVFAYLAVL